MLKQFTLGRNERLKSRKAIDGLFKNGKRFTADPFRVFYAITNEVELKFGTGASTRNFKKAVNRNRIKRLVREAYRLQKNPLELILKEKGKGLHLFIIYTGKELPDYQDVYTILNTILAKLSAIIDERIA